ncbi:MAG: hypothetical protein ABI867_31965 [Kofleriaceae bacterium]
MRTLKIFSSLILFGALAGCTGAQVDDESLYLTGTEESAVVGANGEKECLHNKELVCHIPPGNPANAHTICVGKPAVDPHVANHGDTLGECAVEPTPPPDEPPPQDDDDGEVPVPPPGGDGPL